MERKEMNGGPVRIIAVGRRALFLFVLSLFLCGSLQGAETADPPLADNQAPVADAGNDVLDKLVNEKVMLNGSRSEDEQIDLCTWSWECLSEPVIALTGPGTPTPWFIATITGSHTFQLTLTDPEGLSATDTVNVEIPVNNPPNAKIDSPLPSGPQYEISTPISFSANGSSDPEDRPVNYDWESNVSGPLSTERFFEMTLGSLGWHRISLNVSDPNGGYDVASVDIFVRQDRKAPTAEIAILPSGTGGIYQKGEGLVLDGTMSSDPNQGDQLNLTWSTNMSGGRVLGFGERITVLLEEGHHNISLRATDLDGLYDDDWELLEIRNTLPVAEISAPFVKKRGNEPTVNESEEATFSGLQSWDDDGDELSYRWDLGDGATATGPEVAHSWASFGIYEIVLWVDDGSQSRNIGMDTFTIYVNSIPVASVDQGVSAVVREGFTLSANGSYDEDGDPLQYSWDLDGDGVFDTGGFETYHSYDEEGTYPVTLRVTDGFAWSDIVTEVIVRLPNDAPQARIVGYKEGTELIVPLDDDRGEAELDASISIDPDDDIDGNGVIDGRERNNLTFRWDLDPNKDSDGDDIKDNDADKTGKTVRATVKDVGLFRVILNVTDRLGLFDRMEVRLRGDNPPTIASLSVDPGLTVYVNDTVGFAAVGRDPDRADSSKIRYSWDFGDSAVKINTTNSASHAFTKAGSYIVKVTITDGYLSASYSETVYAETFGAPEINYPNDGQTVDGTITVRGRVEVMAGYIISKVRYRIDDGEWVDAEGTTEWEFLLATTDLSDGKHQLIVRAQVSDEVYSEYTMELTVRNKTSSGFGIYLYIIIIVLLLIIILGVYLLFFRKKKDRRRGLFGPPPGVGPAPPRTGAGPVFTPQTFPPALPAAKSPLQTPGVAPAPPMMGPPAPSVSKKKLRVRCPACARTFSFEDTGERPLQMKCKHCGAKGAIDHVPGDEEGPDEQEPPGEEKEPVPIICPTCGTLFQLKGVVKETKCPSCGSIGELDEGTVVILEERFGVQEPEQFTIKCPGCFGTFKVKSTDTGIICPFCGMSGKLPK